VGFALLGLVGCGFCFCHCVLAFLVFARMDLFDFLCVMYKTNKSVFVI